MNAHPTRYERGLQSFAEGSIGPAGFRCGREKSRNRDGWNGVRMTLTEVIQEDWRANGRDWTRPGFRALAVYRFGVWRMSVEPPLVRKALSVVYRFLYRRVRNSYGIELPFTAQIGRRLTIEHQGSIVVHGFARLGDDCIIRQGVTIGNRHLSEPEKCPSIGHRVNIGAGAILLGDITVGDNAQIGANAVVLQDVPTCATAYGNPATIKVNVAKDLVG